MEKREASNTPFIIGGDITNNPSGRIKMLSEDTLALFFQYDIVTPTTVANAFNDAGVQMNKYRCKFYPETPETMGKKRLNSAFVRKRKPNEVAKAEILGIDLPNHIYVKIVGEASPEGKLGLLPMEVPPLAEDLEHVIGGKNRAERRKLARRKPIKGGRHTPKRKRKKRKR